MLTRNRVNKVARGGNTGSVINVKNTTKSGTRGRSKMGSRGISANRETLSERGGHLNVSSSHAENDTFNDGVEMEVINEIIPESSRYNSSNRAVYAGTEYTRDLVPSYQPPVLNTT